MPNIFDYARKELSQDAFICWLIKFANCEGHELQTASQKFIALLCEIGWENKDVSYYDVGPIKKLCQQIENKIDIFFIAEIKGKGDTCFIIEDKVDSHPHSNQLQRYTEHVSAKYPEHSIVKIYYKTGYLFEDDSKACKKAKYGIVDYRIINEFLDSIETNNLIFTSYRDYIRTRFDSFENGLTAMWEENGHLHLNKGYVQYEFMKRLFEACQEAIGPKDLKTGISLGNCPWAHYRFILLPDAFGEGKHERVWYRIETRKNKNTGKYCLCLSLRQYSENLEDHHKKKKLVQLKKYREIFNQICKDKNDIVFSKPRTDRTGSNSSEISLLFFDGNKNSIPNVLEHLPTIHKEFVTKYAEAQP